MGWPIVPRPIKPIGVVFFLIIVSVPHAGVASHLPWGLTLTRSERPPVLLNVGR